MRIKYIRDLYDKPLAVIVALSPYKIGVCLFKEKGNFPKSLGWRLARQRAISGEKYNTGYEKLIDKTFYPSYYDFQAGGEIPTLREVINFEVDKLKQGFFKRKK